MSAPCGTWVRALVLLALVLLAFSCTTAHATLSIVARDSTTGEIGMAVLSRAIRAGAQCQFVDWRRGGAIAQGYPNMQHMPEALRMMADSLPVDSVIAQIMRADTLRDWRQLGIVDAHGHAAAYTGARTFPSTGQHVGAGYAVQGNSLASDAVLPAMAKAYERTAGDLAARLLAALQAGRHAGGDGPGRGSAAMVISRPGYEPAAAVDPTKLDPWWVDLRVDFAREPLDELAFELRAMRARSLSDSARALSFTGHHAEAVNVQRQAVALDPVDDEMGYALAERLAEAGRNDEAVRVLAAVLARNPALRPMAARERAFKPLADDPRFQHAVRR